MEKMLHRLETFTARGSDGKTYEVHGYEHMARVDLIADPQGQWEPTGQVEYKLADGRHLDVVEDGVLRLAAADLQLQRMH